MFNFFGKNKNENIQNEQPETREEKKDIFSLGFDKLKQAVSKTTDMLVESVFESVHEEAEFSDFVLDDMEDLLIRADLGVNYASELVDKLRNQDKIKPSDVKNYLKGG